MPSLSNGAVGDGVRALQAALAQRGFYGGVVDGRFGAGTDDALRRFQAATGLTSDGKAGPATFGALGLRDEFLPDAASTGGSVLGLPALTGESRRFTRYEPAPGSLFVDGASVDDVQQGELGDCFLLAAVMASVNSGAGVAEQLIHENPDGTFAVRFFGKRGAQTVTVDRRLPTLTDGEGLAYAHARTRSELWVALVEKAYAQWKGGYPQLDGGEGAEVLFELTGRTPEDFEDVTEVPAEQLWRKLEAGSAAHRPMTTGTWDPKSGQQKKLAEYKRLNLLDDHAYALLGVSVQNGERLVTLRDPHGDKEPGMGRDGALDGKFSLRFDDYRRLFADLQIGG